MKRDLKIVPGIFPMPVLMIATYNEDNSIDIMSAAWGMAQEFNQLRLNLTKTHKTVENMRRTGCCTVSLVNKQHVREADYLGLVSANIEKYKFERTGLHATRSEIVDAPLIDEFPVAMECKVLSYDDAGILVEIVNLKVEDNYINDDGTLKLNEMDIVSYDPFSHGYYVVGDKVGQAFEIGKRIAERPFEAQ